LRCNPEQNQSQVLISLDYIRELTAREKKMDKKQDLMKIEKEYV
jgi:hypothetical protein